MKLLNSDVVSVELSARHSANIKTSNKDPHTPHVHTTLLHNAATKSFTSECDGRNADDFGVPTDKKLSNSKIGRRYPNEINGVALLVRGHCQ